LTSYRADLCKPVHQPRGLPPAGPPAGGLHFRLIVPATTRAISVVSAIIKSTEAVVAVDSKIVSATELLPAVDVF
jgi:hypothetical protein